MACISCKACISQCVYVCPACDVSVKWYAFTNIQAKRFKIFACHSRINSGWEDSSHDWSNLRRHVKLHPGKLT